MGIPRYAPWISRKFRSVKNKRIPENVTSLSLDMNTIVHNAASIVCGYNDRITEDEKIARLKFAKRMSPKALLEEIIKFIKTEILTIVDKLRPKHYLIIAFDGVPPRAKMEQQRSRRYGGSTHQPELFDTTSITPGTHFMEVVEDSLTRWFSENASVICRNIIYSGHMEPGEGEHKIFEYFRKGIVSQEIDESELVQGVHIIYGLDADIINIALLSPLKNIHMIRPELVETYNIDNLRNEILDKLHHIEYPIETFIAATCVLGNDFLPNLPTFEILDRSADAMFDALTGLHQSFLIKDGRTIDYNILKDFFKSLINPEVALLSAMVSAGLKSRMIDAAKVVVSSSFEEHVRHKIDFAIFRDAWYTNALAPRDNRLINIIGDAPMDMTEDMEEMGQHYFSGMLWLISYYTGKPINNDWFYPPYHAPLAFDLAHCAAKANIDEEYRIPIYDSLVSHAELGELITPVHQMLAVIPRSSWKIFPIMLQSQVIFVQNYADLFPVAFITENDGKDRDPRSKHMFLHILSRIDFRKIIGIIDHLDIDMDPWLPRKYKIYNPELYIGQEDMLKLLLPTNKFNLSQPLPNIAENNKTYDSTENTMRTPSMNNRAQLNPLEQPEKRKGELDPALPVIIPISDKNQLEKELELAVNMVEKNSHKRGRGGRGRGGRGRGGRGRGNNN